jgi:DNA-binding NarL/FixJ family response regulator
MPHHVFIVEDHPLMREMMSAYVSDLPGVHVCGTARTAEEALDRLTAQADLVLVDVALPGMNGIDLVGEIGARRPGLPCLVCSGHDEASYVRRALRAGARGYVEKGNPAELAEAIRCLLGGEAYLSVSLRARVEAVPDAEDADEACLPAPPPLDTGEGRGGVFTGA